MKISSLFMTIIITAFFPMSGRAQAVDVTKIIEGSVIQISSDYIKILEETNQSEVRMAIDSNTVYDDAQKLSDLKVGDKVQINYHIVQNKNTAISITKLATENGDIDI